MAEHRFTPTTFSNVLGPLAPVLRLADGDSLVTTTLDAGGADGAGETRAGRPNPMTGPFFVDGAEPGDRLLVTIDSMTPNRATGWTYSPVSAQVYDPLQVDRLPPKERVTWTIDAQAGTVRLQDPSPRTRDWSFPIAPMIGCFGVAPGKGQAISTATSGPHGGNMDYRLFGPGTTIAFPVFEPGALFFLGDGHACQGDGEIVGTGIETSFEIRVTLKVGKGKRQAWPRAETATDFLALGSGRPLDGALQHATTEMIDWLVADLGLDAIEASHLLGQAVRYDVANVFNPAYCVACRLPKSGIAGGLRL